MIAYLYVCCVTKINLDEHVYMQIEWKEKMWFYINLCIMLRVTLVVQDKQAKEGLISVLQKTTIKIFFQLFNWKICQKIPIN